MPLLEELIINLAKEFSLPGELKTTSPNTYKIFFGRDLQVIISLNDITSCRCTGIIGALPTEKTEDFLSYMAFANLLGEGTGGSTIFLDNEGKLIYLSRDFTLSNYNYFKENVEIFVNYLEMWQKKRDDAASKNAIYKSSILQPLK
ncbi:MAG: type III secretion system chaperone [Chlamydiae bacterium]|nr:type III secretion system chaperone [Chlamydiota bacterium]